MSQVRISAYAAEVLRFARPHKESVSYPIFDSYAEATTFAASLGYSICGTARPSPVLETLMTPNPIDLQIFKNGNLYPQLLHLCLVVTKDTSIVRDENKICGIIEDYADIGFQKMLKILEEYKEEGFTVELSNELLNAQEYQI
jgi:hypothetical protein